MDSVLAALIWTLVAGILLDGNVEGRRKRGLRDTVLRRESKRKVTELRTVGPERKLVEVVATAILILWLWLL